MAAREQVSDGLFCDCRCHREDLGDVAAGEARPHLLGLPSVRLTNPQEMAVACGCTVCSAFHLDAYAHEHQHDAFTRAAARRQWLMRNGPASRTLPPPKPRSTDPTDA